MSSNSISVWFVCKCGSAYQSMTHFIEHKKEQHFSEFLNVKCIWFEEGGPNHNNNVTFQPSQINSQVSTSNLVVNEYVPVQVPVIKKGPPPVTVPVPDGFGFESNVGIEKRKGQESKPSYPPAVTTTSPYDTCVDIICHNDSHQNIQTSLDIKKEWTGTESNDKDDSFLRVSSSIFSPAPSNNNSDSESEFEAEAEADLLQLQQQLSTNLDFPTNNNIISQTPAQNPTIILQSIENSLPSSHTNNDIAPNKTNTINEQQVSSLGLGITNEILDLKYQVLPTPTPTKVEGDSASLNLISQSEPEPKCELIIYATDNDNENDHSTTVNSNNASSHPSSLHPFALIPTHMQTMPPNLTRNVSRPSVISTSTLNENRFWLNANKPFPPEFKCPLCRTQFTRETDLKLHMKMCSIYNQHQQKEHRLKGMSSSFRVSASSSANSSASFSASFSASSSSSASASTSASQSSQIPPPSLPIESHYRPTFEPQRHLIQNNQLENFVTNKAANSMKCQEPYCEAIFPNLMSLQQHQQHCHSISNLDSNVDHLQQQQQQRYPASFTQQQQLAVAAAGSSKAFLSTTIQNQNQNHHQLQRRHMSPHIPRELLQCPENNCGKVFMSNQSLKNHVREQHGEGREKKFECSMCKKRFSFRALLNDHLLVHSNYRPLQCPIDGCPKTFKRKREVIKHSRICVYSQVNKNMPIGQTIITNLL